MRTVFLLAGDVIAERDLETPLRRRQKTLAKRLGVTWTPFFFKQWGAWAPLAPAPLHDEDQLYIPGGRGDLDKGGLFSIDWLRKSPRGLELENHEFMVRVGKKKAGRELGGQTWDEFPKEAR